MASVFTSKAKTGHLPYDFASKNLGPQKRFKKVDITLRVRVRIGDDFIHPRKFSHKTF